MGLGDKNIIVHCPPSAKCRWDCKQKFQSRRIRSTTLSTIICSGKIVSVDPSVNGTVQLDSGHEFPNPQSPQVAHYCRKFYDGFRKDIHAQRHRQAKIQTGKSCKDFYAPELPIVKIEVGMCSIPCVADHA